MVREIFLVNCPDREFGDRRLVPKWESGGRRDGAGQTEVAIYEIVAYFLKLKTKVADR